MALGHFQSHAVDSAGNVLAGATVTITNESTGGLAILKSDYAGTSSKANGAGFTTELDGYFDFYTTGGFYKIVVEKDGASKTWRYVAVGTLSAYDLDILLNAKRKTVRAATTANIAISTALNNGDTLDGVTLAAGNLVLVKDQTNKYENGIYVVGVTPARHSDFDTYNEHVGAWIAVSEGTTNANRLYVNTDNLGGTLDTTEINFTRVIPNGGSAPLDSPAFTGSFQWTGDISPTSLSADQDDYNPSGLSGAVVIRQATGAFYSINGLQGGSDGRVILIKNAGSNPLQIGAERASSTAAYRFAMSADLLLGPGETAMFEYDSTSSRWVLVGRKPRPEHLEVTPDPFPTVPHKPTVFADFATMPWLDRYIAATRSSEGRAFDRKGIMRSFLAGAARFTTLYSNGESGLLTEPSRTNLLLRSQEFDNASWTKTAMLGFGSGSTANAYAAPDESVTADLLTPTTATAEHFASQDVTASPNQYFSQRIWVRPNGYTRFRIRIHDVAASSNFIRCDYNLTALTTSVTTGGNGTGAAATVEAYPDGWYRLTLSGKPNTSGSTVHVRLQVLDNSGTASFAGDGTSGAYYWGADLQASVFTSSYIPTTSAQVTRAADSHIRSNNDSFINPLEGTLYWEGVIPALDSTVTQALLSLDDTTTSERMAFRLAGSTLEFVVVDGGVTQVGISLGSYTAGTKVKLAARYKLNDFHAAANGVLGTPDTSGTLPTVTQMQIGKSGNGDEGFIVTGKLAYLPRAVTNAQLQAMTA